MAIGKEKDQSTEDKIMEAARTVFTEKGYAATRTRDIAEKAGINLALLNYYFRSKEKLFELVMGEKVQQLFGMLFPIISDASTDLQTKLERIAEVYIDTLGKTPDLPLFVLSEIRHRPEWLLSRAPISKVFNESSFIRQLKEKRPDINPIHFLLNTLGMCLFPFVARPVFLGAGVITEKGFKQLQDERKKMIPFWIKGMLED